MNELSDQMLMNKALIASK